MKEIYLMPVTVDMLLKKATSRLQSAGIDTAALDARILLAYVMEVAPNHLLLARDNSVSYERVDSFNQMINRREVGEPVAYLVGYKEFWDYRFIVTPDTLIPRPDSETLIEAILTDYPDADMPYRIVDFGTGTGCLLLTLLKQFPNAKGVAVDISQNALNITEQNAKTLGVAGQVQYCCSNWGEGYLEYLILLLVTLLTLRRMRKTLKKTSKIMSLIQRYLQKVTAWLRINNLHQI